MQYAFLNSLSCARLPVSIPATVLEVDFYCCVLQYEWLLILVVNCWRRVVMLFILILWTFCELDHILCLLNIIEEFTRTLCDSDYLIRSFFYPVDFLENRLTILFKLLI